MGPTPTTSVRVLPVAATSDGLGVRFQLGVESADLAHEVFGDCLASLLHGSFRADRAQQGGCGRSGQIPRCAAGDEGAPESVELVDGADSGLGQIDPSLVEHGYGVDVAFGLQRTGITLKRGDAGRGPASMRSFLRPPPRESCRTRAVAVVGTSTTSSP